MAKQLSLGMKLGKKQSSLFIFVCVVFDQISIICKPKLCKITKLTNWLELIWDLRKTA